MLKVCPKIWWPPGRCTRYMVRFLIFFTFIEQPDAFTGPTEGVADEGDACRVGGHLKIERIGVAGFDELSVVVLIND